MENYQFVPLVMFNLHPISIFKGCSRLVLFWDAFHGCAGCLRPMVRYYWNMLWFFGPNLSFSLVPLEVCVAHLVGLGLSFDGIEMTWS